MGCLALTYYPRFELVKNGSVKTLTSKKTVLNSRSSYVFGFNGMEKDNEPKELGNSLDFGARIYDSRLGRWLSLDPLASKYPFASPYNFALNTPLQARDPDGKLVVFVNGYRGASAAAKDLLDVFGLDRAIIRKVTSEKIYGGDYFEYWGKMDDKFMNRIGDRKSVYADASSHSFSTANYRYKRGEEAGQEMIKLINAGIISLEKDDKGRITESIKIVSHSQGGAYAAGMSNVLTKAGYKVEVEYYIAPKQPGAIPQTKADRRVQYGSSKDWVAPHSPMKGDVEQGPGPAEDGHVEGHFVENYENVLDVKKGEDGYVAPRKDVKQNGMELFFFLSLLSIFLGSCKSRDQQLKCLEQHLAHLERDNNYIDLKTAIADSIRKWSAQKLKNMISYQDSNSRWMVDAIVFNDNRSKIFGWILKVDNDQMPEVNASDNQGTILDYVEYFTGEKRDGKWLFYLHHMPSIFFPRDKNDVHAYSYSYLSRAAKQKAISGGLYRGYTCKLNSSYIDAWIDRDGRNLYEWHREFLHSSRD